MPGTTQKILPADLLYVSDTLPGISRVLCGQRFRFRDCKGNWLTNREDIRRIRRLAIPPAYTDVWICPLANGYLQATGRDARGRKQYRYHADWSEHRAQANSTGWELSARLCRASGSGWRATLHPARASC